MSANRDRKRLIVLAAPWLTFGTSALATPPYPPAQKGEKVSSYYCRSDVMTFTESWDYSVSKDKKFAVRINGSSLSNAHAERVRQEIASAGPFQSNSAYCTLAGFELAFHRDMPSVAQLRLTFNGLELHFVGVSDGFKVNYKPVVQK